MISRFLSLFNGGMRAYKVQDARREVRIGIVAKNFRDLVQKGCEKLKISEEEVTVVVEDDGTVVDDDAFFKKLPAQTVFVFIRDGEQWHGSGTLIHDALSKLYDVSRKEEIANEIRQMLTDDDAPEKVHIMSQYLDMLETDIEAEHRYENEDWFDGLGKKYKSKSEVLKQLAQTRIRSYYNTAKDQIDKDCSGEQKEDLIDLLDELSERLRQHDYHGGYFMRTAPSKDRFCDKQGWFKCEGPFDEKSCDKFHRINPYASKGYRQLFGLWNLDHVIEKSREIIPALIEAAEHKPKHKDLDWNYVYRLLFTRENLKLVQVGCHKKAARAENKCKREDFYT
ncbi:DNA fragmentation factor subunit beta-like [Liolophura sinensis]|uniref:DNA fragmentation factor subunit beta-like n=1 Tax=Liolophura sinensis TaxID=3198878 RepID=UPI0031584C17